MMRGAVVAGEASAIHAEDYRQLLQADIVNDGVEGALQKCGVDGADRFEALRGHASGEDDCVFLGNAYIEVAFGKMRTEVIERGAVGHGGGDGNNLFVLAGKLDERLREDFRIRHQPRGLGFACLRMVGAESVKLLLAFKRRLETFALLGEDMQQHRLVFSLEELEGLDEQRKMVAVDGTVVFKAEFLKGHRRPENALGCFFGFARHMDSGLTSESLDKT